MYYGKRFVGVGKSSFGRVLTFKDEEGKNTIFVGLSFEEAKEIAKELE